MFRSKHSSPAGALHIIYRAGPITLAALLLAVSAPTLAASNHGSEAVNPAITVEGHGTIRVAPDEARLSMAAEDTDKDLSVAQHKVNAAVHAYVSKAKALGIADKDLSTTGYSVTPEYDYLKDKRVFRGFRVTRNIRLTVRDLGKLGEYLQAATEAGITRVSSPELASSEASRYQLEALARAAHDARQKAQTLAGALGMKAGNPRSLSTVEAPAPRPILMRAMSASATGKQGPGASQVMEFNAGLIEYKARVHAVFDLDQ